MAMALIGAPSLPRLKYRLGRIRSRPRYRTMACGMTQDVCRKKIQALTIAEKAVLDPRKMRP